MTSRIGLHHQGVSSPQRLEGFGKTNQTNVYFLKVIEVISILSFTAAFTLSQNIMLGGNLDESTNLTKQNTETVFLQ